MEGTCLTLSELLSLMAEVAMAPIWTCLTANAMQETRKEESLLIHDKGIMRMEEFSIYGEVVRMKTSLELGHLWLWIY